MGILSAPQTAPFCIAAPPDNFHAAFIVQSDMTPLGCAPYCAKGPTAHTLSANPPRIQTAQEAG